MIQTADAAVLVDAGSAFPGGGNAGEAAVLPALAALGIRRLDLAVVTHADLDHRGGMPAVLRALPVGAVWLPYGAEVDPAFASVRDAARSRGVAVRERGAGAQAFATGGLRVEPLWPPRDDSFTSRNDRSLVVRAEAGGTRLLLAGDLEAASEAALLASGADLRAELLKLSHHGSRTSSTAPFLEAVAAQVGVVSAPLVGRFEMPHASVVRRVVRGGASLWWTGRDGAVMASLEAPVSVWGFAKRRRDAVSEGLRIRESALRLAPVAAESTVAK